MGTKVTSVGKAADGTTQVVPITTGQDHKAETQVEPNISPSVTETKPTSRFTFLTPEAQAAYLRILNSQDSTPLIPSYKPPKIIKLPNGLTIVAQEMPNAISCGIYIWVCTGSGDETEDKNGISHLIEHMFFKGTKTRSTFDIAEQSDSISANLNAFTGRDYTCYQSIPLGEFTPISLEILLDMLFNPRFESFETEKGVVLEEIKQNEDHPLHLAIDLAYRTIWKDHPFGRPIGGTIESVSSFTREMLLDHIKRLYTPDNIIVSLAGKFDLDEVSKQIEQFTSSDKRFCSKNTPPPLVFNSGVSIVEKDIEQANFCLATKGTGILDNDRYAVHILNSALGEGMSSRLFQEVREKRGLVYQIGSHTDKNTLGGLLAIYGSTSPENLSLALEVITQELNKIKAEGLQPNEFEKITTSLRSDELLKFESPSTISYLNGYFYRYLGRCLSPDEINSSIRSVTNENIIQLANQILDPKHFVLSVVGPKGKLPESFKLV